MTRLNESSLGFEVGSGGRAFITLRGDVTQATIDNYLDRQDGKARLLARIGNAGVYPGVGKIIIDLRDATYVNGEGHAFIRLIVERARQPVIIQFSRDKLGETLQEILVDLSERCYFTVNPNDPRLL